MHARLAGNTHKRKVQPTRYMVGASGPTTHGTTYDACLHLWQQTKEIGTKIWGQYVKAGKFLDIL